MIEVTFRNALRAAIGGNATRRSVGAAPADRSSVWAIIRRARFGARLGTKAVGKSVALTPGPLGVTGGVAVGSRRTSASYPSRVELHLLGGVGISMG